MQRLLSKTITHVLAGAVIAGCAFFAQPAKDAGAAEIKWYGQAAFRIKTSGGKVILIDPFITKNPKTPDADKDLSKIGKVDLILVTHGHGDHLGDTGKLAAMNPDAKVGVNADMGHTLRILGIVDKKQLVRFNKSGPINPIGKDITVTMTHAEHSSEIVHKKDGVEGIYPGGEPAGYVIRLEDGYTIYHTGDSGVFKDMELIHDLYKPDLVLICIGGWFTMDPRHAAYAVTKFLKPATVMPMHYGTFKPLKGTPAQFKEHLDKMGDKTDVVVMQPGDEKSFGK